jgi:AcrR family transcriptional regulator
MAEPTATQHDMPRARLTGDERRRTLLVAARAEFARVGYHGASTASIARRAGCSEPMLYKHFADKHALFLEALEDSVADVWRRFDAREPSTASIPDKVHSFIDELIDDPTYLQLLQLRMLAVTIVDVDGVRELLHQLDSTLDARVAEIVARGVADGDIDPSCDPSYASSTLLGLLYACCCREAVLPGSFATTAHHIHEWIDRTAAPRITA